MTAAFTFATLKEKGLITSPVGSDPSLWERWRIQPTGDGLRVDAGQRGRYFGAHPKNNTVGRLLHSFQDQLFG